MYSVDLIAVLAHSFRNRSILSVVVVPIVILGLSLFIDQTYISETVTLRNDSDSSQNIAMGLVRNLQSSLGFTGIGLAANSQQGIAHSKTLTSRRFVGHFIKKNHLAKKLFPDRWDEETQSWISKSRIWIFNDPDFPSRTTGRGALVDHAPTANKLYEKFMQKHLSVREDKLGVITVSLVWDDPNLAARICNDFVEEANQFIRNIDVAALRLNLAQLEQQYQLARIEQLKGLISTLMAEQIKNIALAMSQPEYAFKVIDPALPNYEIHTPNYAGVFIASVILMLLIVVAINYVLLARSESVKKLGDGGK